MCEIADSDGKVQVTIKKISYTLSVGENTVRKNLHRLEEKEYIDIRKTYHDDGGRAANIYIIK